MIVFTAHTFSCVGHSIWGMFRVLSMYNFGIYAKYQGDTIQGGTLFKKVCYIDDYWVAFSLDEKMVLDTLSFTLST